MVSIQVCSWHSRLEDPNFLWAQMTSHFAQTLLGWVFPARPGLTSIICVLHCGAQGSKFFLGHTARRAVWDAGLTLHNGIWYSHYAKVTGDEGLGITWVSGSSVCSAGQSGGAQGVWLQLWLQLRAHGLVCSASRGLQLSWAAAVMGSEQVNAVFKEKGIFKLPKADFHVCICYLLFAKLQKSNCLLLVSVRIQKTI